MIVRLYQILSFDTIQQGKILESPVRLVTQCCQKGESTEPNSVDSLFVELDFGTPEKRLKDLPAVLIRPEGHLRMPLDRPDEGLAGQVHRLDEIVRTAGHLHEVWRQSLDRLVVAAVHTQLLLLQQGRQRRIRQDAHHVGSLIIGRLHGMPDL